MAFTLPDLPYDVGALDKSIDAKTMEIHHGKHHAAYVAKANAALEGTAWADKPVEEVIASLSDLPEDKRGPVRNNAGGHANHTLFWTIMSPDGGGTPTGELASAIDDAFGSFDAFKEQFAAAGANRFGSGWAWLDRRRRQAEARLDGEPGQSAHGRRRRGHRRHANPRARRVGARVLPAVSEPSPGLHRRVVGCGELG